MTSPNDELAALVRELREAATLEQAARLALARLLEVASRALAASEFAKKGKIRQAMLHLRPGSGYRQLVVAEVEPRATNDAHREHNLFSATAFRWVTEHDQQIEIDVTLARVYVGGRRESAAVANELLGEFSSSESRARLLDRSATHLLALPVRARSGAPEGMISIEAQCMAATGLPFIWSACQAELALICDVAAPFLTSLPPSPERRVKTDEFLPVVGKAMAPLVEMLDVFAQQQEPILICGATGSGKSRLARWCHERSGLKDKPFEVVDLSAIPEDLQLAELFGWRRGAFTGAVRDNVGVIARARGGTLFLDEIGNLSMRAQMGLLHVLEERTYRALGDDGNEKPAEVRFIVGTNEDLRRAVAAKRFREDLYYRINVLPVALPALRDRADEIPGWAHFLVNRCHAGTASGSAVEIAPGAQAVLVTQSWPGNLRQLDNIVRRAYAIAKIGWTSTGGATSLVLREEHVRRALAYESPDESETPSDLLLEAASAIVRLAQSLGSAGKRLDLDLLEGFKGLVLGAALEKLDGERDEAFKLFARERLVVARNHHKVLKRELSRAEQLHAAIAPGSPFPFATLLSERDADGSPANGGSEPD
jgi:DNA-binding NtrC family response regulator